MRRLLPLLVGLIPALVLLDVIALSAGLVLTPPLYWAAWAVLAVAAAIGARRYGPTAMQLGAAVCLAAAALLFVFPFGSAKRFYRAAATIEAGMTKSEVQAVLGEVMDLSEDPLLRSSRDGVESWYSEPWFAVCDVEYDPEGKVIRSSTFAFDWFWQAR